MEIEKQIREAICFTVGGACRCDEHCKDKESCRAVQVGLEQILVLLQPAEGELAKCPEYRSLFRSTWNEETQVQRQHMIRQGYVKLPSEEELQGMLSKIYGGFVDLDDAKELHRLLKEGNNE